MIKFILRRIATGFLVIFGVILVVFFLFHALPGDPVEVFTGGKGSPEQRAAIIEKFNLNKPLYLQFSFYLNDISPISVHEDTPENAKEYRYWLSLDLGSNVLALKFPYFRRSYFQAGKRVTEIILEDVEATFVLAVISMFFATIIGVVIGIFAALRQNTWIDYTLVTISVFGISVPSFVFATIVAVIFGHYLHLYTGLSPYGSLWKDNSLTGVSELQLKNLILPVFTLALRPLSIIVQLTRSSMLDVLSQDYIRTAKAKGVKYYTVISKHALKNALNPVITSVSGWLASLITGAFFIEYVFNWKGIGRTTIQAVTDRDLPIVMGATVFIAAVFVVTNIIVDLLYAVIDPRVKIS